MINQYVLNNADDVTAKALHIVKQAAAKSIQQRGRFILSLAGGSTPKKLYEQLAKEDQDWQHWYILYGDERMLPLGSADRNDSMAKTAWLNHIPLPPLQHLFIHYSEALDQNAKNYSQSILPYMPIDLALLGMGEDGHIASLFPQHHNKHHQQLALPIKHSPKPPDERISLSYATLNRSRHICLLISGEAKAMAVKQWQQGGDLPIAKVHGTEQTSIILDQAAATHSPLNPD